MSAARSNRWSRYALRTLSVCPVAATKPAMPAPTRTRISAPPSAAYVYSSLAGASRRNTLARSAATSWRAIPISDWRSAGSCAAPAIRRENSKRNARSTARTLSW
eukprot:Amastigsp_a1878_7.p8 type:complete len:105 gc:universal Amastigsp_a1878_7:980-666(-)